MMISIIRARFVGGIELITNERCASEMEREKLKLI